MVSLSILRMISLFAVILMPIGLVALMTSAIPVDTALFLVLISSLRHPQNRRLCLALVLNLNIRDLLMSLLRSLGLNFFCVSYMFVFLIHHFCCVTTLVLHTWLLTLCYMQEQSMSKLTIILFVKELCVEHSEFNTHPSTDQLVDAMTKPLSSFCFCNLWCKLTILPSPLSLRGDVKPTW